MYRHQKNHTRLSFFALKGPNFNGNAFTKEALEKGAQWVIIDEEAYKVSEQCILVDDVLSCLQQLAIRT